MEDNTVTNEHESLENLEESPEDSNQVGLEADASPQTILDSAVDEDSPKAPDDSESGDPESNTSEQNMSTGDLVEG